MFKKINLRLIGMILLSLADDIIILAIIFIVLPLVGIQIPLWAMIIAPLILLAATFVSYRALRKNPQMGFENVVGLSGVTVEPVYRKGTIRINRELWFARSTGEKIEAGVEVTVVEQTGLKLTVIKKPKADQI